MIRRSAVFALILAGLFTAACSRSLCAEGPTLGKYIPANVHMYGAFKSTPASERLAKPFEDAAAKLIKSGIFEDIFELATIELGDGERDEIRGVISQVFDLVGKADWEALTKDEVAFGFQLSSLFPEYIILFRAPEGSAVERQGELRKILEGAAGFAPDFLYVSSQEKDGAKISTLRSDGVPISVTVASKKDVVALVISASDALLDKSFALIDGKDSADSVVDDPRFIASQKDMPGKAHSQFYFDVNSQFGVIGGLIQLAGSQAGDSPEINSVLGVVTTIFKELRKMKTVGVSERAEGDLYTVDSRVIFNQDKKPGFIEKLIAEQTPIEANFLHAVPKDATSFWMTSGIKPLTVYDIIVSGVREVAGEDGEQALAMWQGIQEQIGFDLREDLLSWIDGGMGVITLPSASGSGSECVVYFRVNDKEKASKFLETIWKPIVEYVSGKGQKIGTVDVDGLDGFEEIRIDALPWFRPVVGLPEGVLVIASSVDAAKRVAAAVSGTAPNISENPRFQVLGLPDGPFTEVFYADVEKSLEDLANLLGGAGFFLSLVPEDPDTRPVIKTGHILTKLAAFLRDVDIAVDYGGWSTYDAEKRQIQAAQVTKLRVPTAAPSAESF